MIFRQELAEKVMAGEKTVTRRALSDNQRSPWYRERCAYQPGKVFTINPGRGAPRVGEAVVVSVRRERLGWLTHDEAAREGCDSPDHFAETIAAIHGSYDETLEVWRIEFELVEATG